MRDSAAATSTGSATSLLMAVLLTAAVAAAMAQPVRSYDLWWHLATGRLIVVEGRIPSGDPFSFTRAGTRWLDHEWLFQLLAYAGFHTAEWRFLVPGTLTLGLATYLLLGLSLFHRAGDAPANWLLMALSLSGARFRFDFRPEMLSYLFLAALCALLHWSRSARRRYLVWLLFPLFTLWANLHPAALLGAAVLLLWLTGEWIQDRAGGKPSPRGSGGLALALASPLALLLNPGSWRLLVVPLEIRRIVASGHAPNQEWLPPGLSDFQLFYGSIAVTVLVLLGPPCLSLVAALFLKRQAPARSFPQNGARRLVLAGWSLRSSLQEIDWPPALASALMVWMGLQQLRNIGFFFLLLPLALGRPLSDLLRSGRIPPSVVRVLGGVVLVLLTPIFLRQAPGWNEPAVMGRVTPAAAVRFLEQNRVGRRLFNDVKFGGYLIWKRYPAHRVFIDGRNEIYDPLLKEIFLALGSWEGWQGMLDRHDIDAAMLRRGQIQAVEYPPDPPDALPRREMRAFSAAYFQKSEWALIYWDDLALIFVRRRDPAYTPLLEKEYRFVNPDDAPHLMHEIRRGQVRLEDALREVQRKLEEDPGCSTALALRERLTSLESVPPS